VSLKVVWKLSCWRWGRAAHRAERWTVEGHRASDSECPTAVRAGPMSRNHQPVTSGWTQVLSCSNLGHWCSLQYPKYTTVETNSFDNVNYWKLFLKLCVRCNLLFAGFLIVLKQWNWNWSGRSVGILLTLLSGHQFTRVTCRNLNPVITNVWNDFWLP